MEKVTADPGLNVSKSKNPKSFHDLSILAQSFLTYEIGKWPKLDSETEGY